jgi:hypothetical protein
MATVCEACGNEPEEDTELDEEGLCEDCSGFVELCVKCDQWKKFDELDENCVCETCQELEEEEEEEDEDDDDD